MKKNDLTTKLSASSIEKRYRTGEGFRRNIIEKINGAIVSLNHCFNNGVYTRQNKATLFSWLYFLCDNLWLSSPSRRELLIQYFSMFEQLRAAHHGVRSPLDLSEMSRTFESVARYPATQGALRFFNDRASSRVNDVSSVLLRDLALNTLMWIAQPADVYDTDKLALRIPYLQKAEVRLSQIPDDIYERLDIENELTDLWYSFRAPSEI